MFSGLQRYSNLWVRISLKPRKHYKSQSQLRWSHLHSIRMSAVHIIFIFFIPFTGTMNSINWPAPNVWVFIAQLVKHCNANHGFESRWSPENIFRVCFAIASIAITTVMITSSFNSYVRSSLNIHMIYLKSAIYPYNVTLKNRCQPWAGPR